VSKLEGGLVRARGIKLKRETLELEGKEEKKREQ
jgi:hypothetical protein